MTSNSGLAKNFIKISIYLTYAIFGISIITLSIRNLKPELIDLLSIEWVIPKHDTSELFIIFPLGLIMRGHSSLSLITRIIVVFAITLISVFNIYDLEFETTILQFDQFSYNAIDIARHRQNHTSIPSSICFIIASMTFLCSTSKN